MKSEGGIIGCHLIAAFVDSVESASDRRGNVCRLILSDSDPCQDISPPPRSVSCQSWLQSSKLPVTIGVRCYTPDGRLIQCCGHGLLAASHSWMTRLQCETLTLCMQGSLIQSWRSAGMTWLRFSTPNVQPCEVPPWSGKVLFAPEKPVAAACSGGSSGYMVLQWPDGFDLNSLTPPGDVLGHYTQRALICTSAQDRGTDGAVQLRYFAPQYGVLEDAATGSAMRVLAPYWSSRFDCLQGDQCSPSGGHLLARLASPYVEVGGMCKVIEAVAVNGNP